MIFIMPDEMDIIPWLTIGTFSVWGGIVRYLLERSIEGKESFNNLLSQLAVSGFSGFIGGLIIFESDGSYYLALISSGMSGFLGKKILHKLQKKILNT